jgi:iron uptake system component EfeO
MLIFVLWPTGRSLRPSARATAPVAGILLMILGLGACGSSSDGEADAEGAPATGGVRTVAVQISDEGCLPATLKLAAGPTTFEITAKGSGKATEYEIVDGDRILGERESLTPGLSGTFSLDLAPGEYESYCPGADRERGKVIVTGTGSGAVSSAATDLKAATVAYGTYVEGQAELLVERTTAFVAAVKAGDVARAKRLFAGAREPWERIEPVAEAFGDLDPRVDARVNDVAAGDEWTGFHRIEQALWKHSSTKGMATVADTLLADVKELAGKVEGLEYQPAQLANGATELLGEVSRSKITGEEDRYSHTDLWDFAANVDGAHEAFELLEPALSRRDPALLKQVDEQFDTVRDAIAAYRKGDGYVLYTALGKDEVRVLSQKIDALAEPLSKVAAAVVAR